jgi:hypothetical protein
MSAVSEQGGVMNRSEGSRLESAQAIERPAALGFAYEAS